MSTMENFVDENHAANLHGFRRRASRLDGLGQ